MRWLELSLGSICELWELVTRMLRENFKADGQLRKRVPMPGTRTDPLVVVMKPL